MFIWPKILVQKTRVCRSLHRSRWEIQVARRVSMVGSGVAVRLSILYRRREVLVLGFVSFSEIEWFEVK